MSVLPRATGFILVLFIFGGLTFNLDTKLYTKYRGDPGSMFGFSVSMHREAGISRVLVGAPKAQTNQPGVTRGGAVYSCDISSGSSCSQIPFDENGPDTNSRSEPFEIKSNQWFGASVYSAGENGPVIACAPRYIYNLFFINDGIQPVGTCFLARNQFSNFSEYSPCRTTLYKDWGKFKLGYCQVGFGAIISRDGERLFLGAVGSRNWKGMLFSLNPHSRRDVISTKEGPESEDGSYLGYSMAVGDFGGSVPGHEDVAVGRPRGADLLGQVLLFTWNMTSIQNITGEQLGAYFGYAIASGDIDGDKKDDLIIGAPFYTDFKNKEGKYETGRVYIRYQGTQVVRFNKLHVKDGKNTKGRFGLSLASLGDINNDGYGDFAVGAPYDGPEERGAVYIFHGSANGVRDTHSQVIYSENIVGTPSTFGFSIAGRMDLDRNGYPDLIIGAYDSDTAVYLRAKPVVKMDAYISFAGEGKQIGLDERNCNLRDGTKVPCIQLSSCLQYDGIGVGRTLDFEVQYVLDSKKTKSPRMFFILDENRSVMNKSIRLKKGQKLCEDMLVFLKNNIRDKLTSIDAEIRYSLLTNYTSGLTPVLDLNQELSRKDSISIKKNCGNDNICIPDLRLIAQTNVQRYLLGSGERLNLNILVQNEGEDSFETTFETSIPPGLNYVKIERIDEAEREIPVQCSAPSFLNNNTLHCDIGNPLPKEKLVEFRVILQPYHLDGMNPRYEFNMKVNSINPGISSSVSDNFKKITVPIWIEADLVLQGSSHPADVHFNSSLYEKTNNFIHETEIGPQVIHVYGIRNKGPSDIVEAVAYFLWPSYTLAGDHLLYLLEQPETLGNIKCEYVEEVNVENLALDRKRKSFLDPHAEIGIQAGLHSESGSSTSTKHESSSSSESVKKIYTSSSSSSSHSSSQGRMLTEEERRFEEMARREQGTISSSYESTIRHGRGTSMSGSESSSHSQGHSEARQDGLHHSHDRGSAGSEYESSGHRQGHDRHLSHHSSGGSIEAKNHEGVISKGHHGTRHEGSRQHSGTTNINLNDLLKEDQASGSQSASFYQFGETTRGPSDRVARTYGLDLGLYSGGQVRPRHHGAASDSDSRSIHYSSDRSGSTSGTVATKEDDINGYSYRSSDRLEGYAGSRQTHSLWSSSYTSGTADGDRPQHGGAYGTKVVEGTHHRQISDEANIGKFKLYPRYKRDASEDLENSLTCGPTDCTRIKCMLGPLKKDDEVWVAFPSRVWVPTMKKLSTIVEVGLSSLVAAKVTKLPHIGTPDVVTTHTHEVHSKIMPPESGVKPDIIPLWIVLVSACAGAIILMLLVYLLYKCGFFKRNRPSDENQPFYGNGHIWVDGDGDLCDMDTQR